MSAFYQQVDVVGINFQAAGAGSDGFFFLPHGGMGLGELQDQFDVLRVLGEGFFGGGNDAFFVGEGMEIAAEGGVEFEWGGLGEEGAG